MTFHQGVYKTRWKTNSATARSQLGGSLKCWRKKTRRIWLHTQNLSSKSTIIVSQGISVESLLVMKHACTSMNLGEQQKTERGCPKEETRLKLQKEIDLRRRYRTRVLEGSPSCGGEVTVYVWHKPLELAHSFLFCSCVYFCLCGPFNCISFHPFSRQLSTFRLCSSGLVLPHWSFQLYISLRKSPSALI